MITSKLSKLALWVVPLAIISMLSGCSLVGLATNSSDGPEVKAKYVPKKKDKMLVLVEAYGLEMDSGVETQHMTIALRKKLEEEKVASLVDDDGLERLKDNTASYQPLTIADIGRKLGASQVLYVNVWQSEIVKPAGSGQMRGHMEAMVKVVDTTTGDTRWPTDAPSEAVQITTAWIPEDRNETETALKAQMADQMAADIGQLFHDYNPDLEPMPKIDTEAGGVN